MILLLAAVLLFADEPAPERIVLVVDSPVAARQYHTQGPIRFKAESSPGSVLDLELYHNGRWFGRWEGTTNRYDFTFGWLPVGQWQSVSTAEAAGRAEEAVVRFEVIE